MNRIVADLLSCQNQIDSFFENQRIALLLRQSNILKQCGIAPVAVMRVIFCLAFTGKNLFRYLQAAGSGAEIGKDTVYRFLNSVHANWRKFLHLLSAAVIRTQILPLTAQETPKVFIVDDSLYSRDRSKKVELLARVHDHNQKRYYRGFRLLTLGWSDGSTYVPISFSLLSSANKKNRLTEMAAVDKRTNGFRRRAESLRKAPEMLKELLMQARNSGISADYLLFDSWFAFPSVIIGLLEQKQQVICMLKAMKTITYGYKGFDLTLDDLYKSVYKRRGRAKVLASALVELGKNAEGEAVMAKIVFVRDRSKKKWLALLSTDVELADEQIIALYKRRWDIEVFFKITKSYLNLAKEFQSRSYDALVAHTSIVFARYIMLALARRTSKDPRTLGSLFHAGCDELRQVSFAEALRLLLDQLEQLVKSFAETVAAPIMAMLAAFIAQIPDLLRRSLLLPTAKF
ncbi:IS4 family transposase [Geoalkalibacter halelectricus]|uniref:Transposase n=1 Tax=Geoalkalibacter halelectricus TaxID=2847045 RepID=A0ABY5ZKV7_9BACT|nr:transposase [Geoalkalibacter halelectricus]MDO3377850.1 transposase [Geoalkalibacter halelectricus]UWZ79753.1 transposase [Geoalkalibacter halelectricus]